MQKIYLYIVHAFLFAYIPLVGSRWKGREMRKELAAGWGADCPGQSRDPALHTGVKEENLSISYTILAKFPYPNDHVMYAYVCLHEQRRESL